MDKLSYSLLNNKEQAAYRLLEQAILNHRKGCDFSIAGWNIDIRRVWFSVFSDHPEFVNTNRNTWRQDGALFPKRVSFAGMMSAREEKEREKKLSEKLNDAVFEIDKNARTDREIIQGISEYLQRTVKYDYKALSPMSNVKTLWCVSDAHNAYGALVNKLAVCEGFSAAFSLVANEFGMRNMSVSGTGYSSFRGNGPHAWNIVEYEGSFYHVDVTYDSGRLESFNEYGYEYFGLTDDEIAINHKWDFRTTPKCSEDALSYYVHNKLIAYSEDQIDAIASRELKLGRRCIRIKIAPNLSVPNDNGEYIANKIENQLFNQGISDSFQYGWDDNTRCFIVTLV